MSHLLSSQSPRFTLVYITSLVAGYLLSIVSSKSMLKIGRKDRDRNHE